jgi:hypothetical protein
VLRCIAWTYLVCLVVWWSVATRLPSVKAPLSRVAGLEEPRYTNDCTQSAAGVNGIPAGYLLSLALPPLDTLANPPRSIEGHDLFGAEHDRLETLPEVTDTAAVPPVPALQHTHGKSTSGFAGSEPPVPFRGRPPECNTRPLERQDYSSSLDYTTEEMSTMSYGYSLLDFHPSRASVSAASPADGPTAGGLQASGASWPYLPGGGSSGCRLQGAPMWTACPRSLTTPVSSPA